MGDAVELLADRGVDHRVAVAVDVAPEGGGAVEVALPVDVEEVGALAALDHQRLFLAPALLLGEGVPDVIPIELRVVQRHGEDVSPAGGGSRFRICITQTTFALLKRLRLCKYCRHACESDRRSPP